jgi:S1-C subfamily serine protease
MQMNPESGSSYPGAGYGLPGQPPPGRERPHWLKLRWIAAAVAGALLLTAVEAAVIGVARTYLRGTPGASSNQTGNGQVATVPQAGSAITSGGQLDVQAIATRVEPEVVDINTTVASLGQPGRAAGTGIIVTADGEVLTNHHVVQGATDIEVTVQGHGTHGASVVGVSTTEDIALLKVSGVSNLPTATFADSATLEVGEAVVAIGNALGRGSLSVTQGTITALDQSITASDGGNAEDLSGLIEMNAPIAPGDSGGPLINAAGQVVGMDTAGASAGRRAVSVAGYAIPSNTLVSVINEIETGSNADGIVLGVPGYLGVAVSNLNVRGGAGLGLGVTTGALVTGVASGSPAARAGIAAGAVITAINGAPISSADALGPAIQAHRPGQQIQVSWIDGSGAHTTTVTLASGPAA